MRRALEVRVHCLGCMWDLPIGVGGFREERDSPHNNQSHSHTYTYTHDTTQARKAADKGEKYAAAAAAVQVRAMRVCL